jgi:hypothetical protein
LVKNILEAKFTRIAFYAKDTMISICEGLQAEMLDELFFLPLSVQAARELDSMLDEIQNITFDEDEDDN